MNSMQRTMLAATLAVIGVLCLFKTWVTIYSPAREFLGLRVEASVAWNEVPMGWLLGGVVALGAGAYLWMSRRSG